MIIILNVFSYTEFTFYYSDRINKLGVAIVSCNDGLHPVIMKLEVTDEDAKIEYKPIER